MRVSLMTGLLIFCIAIVAFSILKAKFNLFKKIIICIAVFIFFLGGSSIINLNTLGKDVKAKVDKVIEICGDSYITTKGGSVIVKIEDDWVDIEEIKIIGDFAKDCKIEYDGKIITIKSPGVKGTLKVMESLGLLE